MEHALVGIKGPRLGSKIQPKGSGDLLTSLRSSKGEVKINGLRPSKVPNLNLGDHVQIDSHQFIVVPHELILHPTSHTLLTIAGENIGRLTRLVNTNTRIRAASGSAILASRADGVFVKVNEEPSEAQVHPGSHLQVGNSKYVLLPPLQKTTTKSDTSPNKVTYREGILRFSNISDARITNQKRKAGKGRLLTVDGMPLHSAIVLQRLKEGGSFSSVRPFEVKIRKLKFKK